MKGAKAMAAWGIVKSASGCNAVDVTFTWVYSQTVSAVLWGRIKLRSLEREQEGFKRESVCMIVGKSPDPLLAGSRPQLGFLLPVMEGSSLLKRNQQRQTWPAAAMQRPLRLFPDTQPMSQKQWLRPKAREFPGGPVVKDLTLAAKGLGSIPGQQRSGMACSQKIKIHK